VIESESILNHASQKIVDGVIAVVGSGSTSLHEPEFSDLEWMYVRETLESTFVSSIGKHVVDFEIALKNITGAEFVIATVNGTAALHVALQLSGVGSGDEVLVPSLTFVATANAVIYCGAIPHFVDSSISTLGVDPIALRTYLSRQTVMKDGECINKSTGRRIRALVPMHTFGHPVCIDALVDVAKEFNLILIEDAAESLGSKYRGKHTGTFGLFGVLSFNGNKIITTGGGGAILCNDKELAGRAKHITTTARVPHRWGFEHDMVGYNYRLPNINAALGCAQLERLPSFLERKRALFQYYSDVFMAIPGAKIFSEPENCESNYWLQILILDKSMQLFRDEILDSLNESGVGCRPAWKLMHKLAPFQDFPRMSLEVAEDLEARIIAIPSSPSLAEKNER
jgi:perosamine synthetase